MSEQLALDFNEEVKVGQATWVKRGVTKSGAELWFSSYYSADGDGVVLQIYKDKFYLQCFSGVPGSYILLDHIDYDCVWKKTNYKSHSISKYSTTSRALILADYFCNLHCEFINTKNYKTNDKN